MNNPCFLQNERIRLRAVEPEDLTLLYEIENDPRMWENSCFNTPYSRYVLKEYIVASQCDIFADKQLRLMIERLSDHVVLGTLDLTDFDPLHRRAAIGIALLKTYRGEGYAAEALTLLCTYAFDFLRMHQLYVHIAADNDDSLRLFEANGFVRCGLLKEWLSASARYKDAILLQRISTK